MKFVTLTKKENGKLVKLSPQHVVSVEEDTDGSTLVMLTNDRMRGVKETPFCVEKAVCAELTGIIKKGK